MAQLFMQCTQLVKHTISILIQWLYCGTFPGGMVISLLTPINDVRLREPESGE